MLIRARHERHHNSGVEAADPQTKIGSEDMFFDGDYENEDRVDGNDDAEFDDDDDDDGDDKYLPNGKPKRCGRIEGNNSALLRHNNNTTLETLNLSGLGRSTGTAGIIDAGWTATFQLQWDPNSALEKLRLLKNSFVAD